MSTPAENVSPDLLLICPTTHLDWDWLVKFGEYVTKPPPCPPADPDYTGAANVILGGVCDLLAENSNAKDDGGKDFRFSLAEVSYLREFLKVATPRQLSALKSAISATPPRFVLLGGGITSPDNLLCHGEVFIRNYLRGRQWLKSQGLAGSLASVAWLPDDFGHDPQLPVVLEAMGLKWVGLSRVPGSPQPFSNKPLNYKKDDATTWSVAEQLGAGGLVFQWTAHDKSQVVAHFMPLTYGGIWDGNNETGSFLRHDDPDRGLNAMKYFVKRFCDPTSKDWPRTVWPTANGAPIMLATAGGDFVLAKWPDAWPKGDWRDIINSYNAAPDRTLQAQFATFQEFMDKVGTLPQDKDIVKVRDHSPLLAQNYWTGQFASRPILKLKHYGAAQLTLAAEAATTLLRVISTYSAATLKSVDDVIDAAWEELVPSSHHDYITGTSVDEVFGDEQVYKLARAVEYGEKSLTQAVGLIAAAVKPRANPDTPVVVFNPLGFARGGVVELPAEAVPWDVKSVGFDTYTNSIPVQRLPNRGLLFQVPQPPNVDSVGSFGYMAVELARGTPKPPNPPVPLKPSGPVTLKNAIPGTGDNPVVEAVIDGNKAWSITSLVVNGKQVLKSEGPGNLIRIYRDDGNIYQFGNEPLPRPDGPLPDPPAQFIDSGTRLTAGVGEWLEWGPLRWHFQATLIADGYINPNTGKPDIDPNTGKPYTYTLDYILYFNDPVLRIRLSGAAPTRTSVLTRFDLGPPVGSARPSLTYGTANHYDDHEPVPYWTGPTFRATHDFAQTTGTDYGLAIYHQSVPAWSVVTDKPGNAPYLLGALLRNTPGVENGQRGATGTDFDYHILEYAVGPAGNSVSTGDALRTALAVTNPLVGAVIPTNSTERLPRRASLAAITSTGGTTPPTGILRAARTQEGSSVLNVPGHPDSSLERISFILRAYLPDRASNQAKVTITLPDLPDGAAPSAKLVTALEESPTDVGTTPAKPYVIPFLAQRALATVQVTTNRRAANPA